jgi:tetratricopeptide (TPR) repeat protein
MFKGNYEEAVRVGRRAVKANPEFSNAYKPLIAAMGQLGLVEEAKPYVEKLMELEPEFTVKGFAKVYPIKKEADRERYMDGLRKAGVPEG